jgi:hypothetical protein
MATTGPHHFSSFLTFLLILATLHITHAWKIGRDVIENDDIPQNHPRPWWETSEKPRSIRTAFGIFTRAKPHVVLPDRLIDADTGPLLETQNNNGVKVPHQSSTSTNPSTRGTFGALRNVRQLFFDDWILHRADGIDRRYHQAEVVGAFNVTTIVSLTCYPWIDAVWRHPRTNLYWMWHACVDATSCVSFSHDGVEWGNTTATKLRGPMTVRERGAVYPLNGGSSFVAVWFMYPLQRESMHPSTRPGAAELKPSPLGKMYTFRSTDGLIWDPVPGAESNFLGDASSSFYDPFRNAFFIVAKINFAAHLRVQFLWRVASLAEKYPIWTDVFSRCVAAARTGNTWFAVQAWRSCMTDMDNSRQLSPLPLVDRADPLYGELVYKTGLENDVEFDTRGERVADAYTFSSHPYESFLIGVVAVQSGGLPNRPKRMDPYLAFSRGDIGGGGSAHGGCATEVVPISGRDSRSLPHRFPDTRCHPQPYPVFARPRHDQRLPIINYDPRTLGNVGASSAVVVNGGSSQGPDNLLQQLPGGISTSLLYVSATPYSLTDDINQNHRGNGQWRWPRNGTIVVGQLRRDGWVSLFAPVPSSAAPSGGNSATLETKWLTVADGYGGARVMVNIAGCSTESPVNVTLVSDQSTSLTKRGPDKFHSRIVLASGTSVDVGLQLPREVGTSFFLRISWSAPGIDLYSFWAQNDE